MTTPKPISTKTPQTVARTKCAYQCSLKDVDWSRTSTVTSALRKIGSLQPKLDIARARKYLLHRIERALPKGQFGSTCPAQDGMSASLPKPHIGPGRQHVCFVPRTDIEVLEQMNEAANRGGFSP